MKSKFDSVSLLTFYFLFTAYLVCLCWAFVAVIQLSTCGCTAWICVCSAQTSHCSGFSCFGRQAQECGLQKLRILGSRTQPQQLLGMGLVALRHLPGIGMEPVSPTLADTLLSTEKSSTLSYTINNIKSSTSRKIILKIL